MKQSLKQWVSLTTLLFAGVMVLALLDGCGSSQQTTSGSQEVAKPVTPPPPPPPPAPEPPPPPPAPEPPPPVQEMAPQAAAPPEDPLAWAAGLADVHFEYKLAKIRKKDKSELDALAQKLKEDSNRKVLLEGHCDSRGTANYNMMLGERRAKAVKQHLVKAGVPASQIEVTSYGKERQLCTKATDGCWQSNRRVHFQPQ